MRCIKNILILSALVLAACAGVPKPLDGNRGILLFKPVFNEDRFSNVTTLNGMQSGMSSRVELEITLENRNTREEIILSIAASGRIFSVYNLPAGQYRVREIRLISITTLYRQGAQSTSSQTTRWFDISKLPPIEVKANSVTLYGTINAGTYSAPDQQLLDEGEKVMELIRRSWPGIVLIRPAAGS